MVLSDVEIVDDDEYIVSLYDKKGRKIEEIVFPKKPNIKELGNDLIEIEIVLGNPVSYIFYFNQKTLQISSTFFNSVQMEGKYVAYIDGSRLIVQDIFSEGILHEEIVRDFSVAIGNVNLLFGRKIDYLILLVRG